MTAWDDYVATMRELDAMRSAHGRARSAADERRRAVTADLDDLDRRLVEQRARLGELAHHCRFGPLPTHPAPASPAPPEGAVETARALVADADAAYGDARYLAHRPKLLPRWRSDDRNGLVYGGFALVGLLVMVAILSIADPEGGIGGAIGLGVAFLAVPAAAFAAGWLAIGVVGRPMLGEPVTGPGGRIDRNPRLGGAICASTLLVVCWLGGVYLY